MMVFFSHGWLGTLMEPLQQDVASGPKQTRHPVESKTLCDFHLKPQHPSAAQERWEKVEEEEQEDTNKRQW